jgi:GT2 family glycosyltransferase
MTDYASLANRCAILIPTYARSAILRYSLDRMRGSWMAELPLIVYDDGSPDPMAIREVVASWPKGRVIRGEKSLGQSAGRNILMRACEQEYALVLDDDQYFLDFGNIKETISSGMDKTDKSAVITFARINKSTGRRDIPERVPACKLPVFQGGTALFHIPSILSVGGFRDFLGFGYEEPDLSMRLFWAGFTIWYEPSIVMEHNQFYSADEFRDTAKYDYYYARNAVLISSMNMPLWYGLLIGLVRSVRRMMVFNRNYLSKIRGLTDGILDTFRYWSEREPVTFSKCQNWNRFRKKCEQYLN